MFESLFFVNNINGLDVTDLIVAAVEENKDMYVKCSIDIYGKKIWMKTVWYVDEFVMKVKDWMN